MLSYSFYKKLKKTCVILNSKSRRYKEYIRRGFAYYDMSSVLAKSLTMLIKEKEKLKLEREAAFCSTIKSIARVNRL
jgi:hypothetical protein